jgi:hypothetical protein
MNAGQKPCTLESTEFRNARVEVQYVRVTLVQMARYVRLGYRRRPGGLLLWKLCRDANSGFACA